MKKYTNKKWIVLLEAIIAMTTAMLIVSLLYFINIQLTQNLNNVDKIVSVTLAERFKQDLYYLKDKTLKKWMIDFHETSDPIPGWDNVSITSDWKTLDELNWIYKLNESCWAQGICLEKIWEVWDDVWSKTFLISGFLRYDVDSNGKLVIEENESDNILTDCDEPSNVCIQYRMIIENAESDDYEPIKYILPSWIEKTLNNKKKVVFQLLNNELNNIQEFYYVLTPNY